MQRPKPTAIAPLHHARPTPAGPQNFIWSLLTFALCALAVPSATQAQAGRPEPLDSVEAELERYKRYFGRPSLQKRTDGRNYLARSRAPEALKLLLREYAKPPDAPTDHVKYLLASILTHYFGDTFQDSDLNRILKRHKKPVDAWMWHEMLRRGPWSNDRERLFAIVDQPKNNVFCRGAALAAVIESLSNYDVDEDAVRWAKSKLGDALPKKPMERAMLLEGIAAMFVTKSRLLRENDDWKELCRAVLKEVFENPKSLRRTKVVLASQLAKALDSQNLGFEFRYWNVELDRPTGKKRGPASEGNTSTVGFAGIRTKGDRIVFVIDASDSMLKPIHAPVGGSGPTTGRRKKRPEKGVVPTADDLDWDRITTRFDAAREFLRIALMTLEDEQEFAVVLFGDQALALQATPTLKKASPKRIEKALKELWSLEVLAPTANRPNGRLRGQTNFHGGMRLAFRMTKSGITEKAEYADSKSMLEGCDTVFVLTDGQPTSDDWMINDTPEDHDIAGDPESGVSQEKTEELRFSGPYGTPYSYDKRNYGYLLDDVKRLNLLRRCEIHCVGIGEADQGLLTEVAKIGSGQSIRVDDRLKKPDGDPDKK